MPIQSHHTGVDFFGLKVAPMHKLQNLKWSGIGK